MGESCFGLKFDKNASECQVCGVNSLCEGIIDGYVSWQFALSRISSYRPVDEIEKQEREELILHIRKQILEKKGDLAKAAILSDKDLVMADTSDTSRTISELEYRYGVRFDFLDPYSMEVFKRAIAAIPFGIAKVSLGGGVNKYDEPLYSYSAEKPRTIHIIYNLPGRRRGSLVFYPKNSTISFVVFSRAKAELLIKTTNVKEFEEKILDRISRWLTETEEREQHETDFGPSLE